MLHFIKRDGKQYRNFYFIYYYFSLPSTLLNVSSAIFVYFSSIASAFLFNSSAYSLSAIDAIEAAGKTVGSDIANGEIMVMSFDTTNAGLTDTLAGKIACDVECNPLHGPRAEELIKALEAGEEVEKLNYVDEEIFATDDTVDKVKAVNSLDEEGEYDVTPITQEIIDGRAY